MSNPVHPHPGNSLTALPSDLPVVLTLAHPALAAPDPALVGGKAAALARLYGRGLPVPPLLVIPSPVAASLLAATAPVAQIADAATAQAALAGVTLPPAARAALVAALAQLAPAGSRFAVRSSAVDEDSRGHSFAGQLASFLDVPAEAVVDRVVDVWRSGYTPHLFAYRAARGLTGAPQPPAVLIQPMIAADAAGVAFSADPVQGRRGVAVVAAVRGVAAGLVGGTESGDSWQVDRDGQVIARTLLDPAHPILDDAAVAAVAALARRCAAAFAMPQDIEWARAGGQLFLLQSRPITTLADRPDPDGVTTLWDNSNIIESYGGMTTPLTYSFARRAYQAVYQELVRILGVPRGMIQANQAVFANMIGLIHGRIYYNLLNWYRVLALLPGFKANRRFMEQMMGVKESLPADIVADLAAAGWREKLADRLYLARTVVGLLLAYAGQDRRERRFYARLDRALGKTPPDLSLWRADELLAYYRRLESDLLPNWDAPLVNDFFAMIFYGLLRQLATSWVGDAAGTLQNDLLTDQGGMISAEPAGRVRTLGELARQAEQARSGWLADLLAEDWHRRQAALTAAPDFAAAYAAYLADFGERCLAELKLESPTLHDEPRPLLRAVAQVAQQPPLPPADAGRRARAQAEARVADALRGKPLRRGVFGWVLANARRRVVARENLRFARTQVFGRARLILRELGARLVAAGALSEVQDVFYLTVDEVCGWVEGTLVNADLAGLVSVRRAEYTHWASLPPLPSRFATQGAVYGGNEFAPAPQPTAAAEELPPDTLIHAVGAAPGRVVGRTRLVRDPLTADLEQGDIVVAEHTDPSWILILPLAGGLVVERGSLLSHAAIVARELGIPAVVGATGALARLTEGARVEVDGAAGTVRRAAA